MTKQPQQNRPTAMTQMVTQLVQNAQTRVNQSFFSKLTRRKAPELWVYEKNKRKPKVYPLTGSEYLIGRSSSCDIAIYDLVVSQRHCSLKRDHNKPHCFRVIDQNSTNGLFVNKNKVKSTLLRHGDKITLAPPKTNSTVKLKYHHQPPPWLNFIRYSIYGTSGIMGVFALWLGIQWSQVSVKPLPQGVAGPVVVYARDGQTALNPLYDAPHQELENLSDFSPYLPKAVIASEDTRYYWHLGVDPIGILRALLVNFQEQEISQGGSTITQQLARSLFPHVGRENTKERKLREMAVALKLEAVYSKDEILRTYLNRVYLGVNSYGFEDAAQFYFDKSARDLSLSEAATLVAILPAPNLYNPVHDYDTAVSLRNRVIERMASLGMITSQEASRARRSRIEVSEKARKAFESSMAPYFYSYVLGELRSLLGEELAKEGNFIVETSLYPQLQQQAETSLQETINNYGPGYNFSQGAVVTLNSETGAILALTGGVDYSQSQFNRAIQAQRQPGSTFKVFTYGAAIEQGISPRKKYSCDALFWKGQRFKECQRSTDDINMYESLAQSENAVALRIAQDVGLESVVEMAKRLGIQSPLNPAPGLVLGQSEVNLLEITGTYATFANDGLRIRPHAIIRILDANDCVADELNPDVEICREIYSVDNNPRRVISPRVAQTMTALMQEAVENGTGRLAYLGLGEAGKTGTTDNSVDLWFIGYLTELNWVTGVWLGNDDNSPTWGSSTQAATLWGDYMEQVVEDDETL